MSVLYKAECIGKNGRPITVCKFRTMYPGAHDQFEQACKNGVDHFGKPVNDTRVTPLGRFLRASFIDELPQLINYLKGEIDLVGVRPIPVTPPNHWEILFSEYPREEVVSLQKRALRFIGLWGVHYANHGDIFTTTRNFIELAERDEVAAKVRFFTEGLLNLIFRRVKKKQKLK